MTDGHFAVVPIEVIQDRRLTLEQTRVLIALFSFRNKVTNTVWPSRAAIAERTGMHPSNISAATTVLATLGWLMKVGSGGHSKATRYTLSSPSETVAHPATVAERATVAASATPPLAESATPPVADSARGKEQTTEQTTEQTICQPALPAVQKLKAEKVEGEETELQAACRSTWRAYSSAYSARYGAAPVRNASVNAKIKAFVQRIGYSESPGVAAFYVERVSDSLVVRKLHEVGLLLSGAEGYRTQWATDSAITGTRAQQIDQSQSNFDAAEQALVILHKNRQSRQEGAQC